MTDRLREQLSAFLDGELPEAETTLLLKRLERDDELKGTLSRYSLIGAVMRTDGDVPAARHVAARVSAVIAGEPALGGTPRYRWTRPAAGLAVAASVAMATVLALPQWLGGDTAAPDRLVAGGGPVTASTTEPAAVIVPVVASIEEAPARPYTTPPAPADAAGGLPSAQLAAYLVAHSEYTSPLARRAVVTTLTEAEPPVPEPAEATR